MDADFTGRRSARIQPAPGIRTVPLTLQAPIGQGSNDGFFNLYIGERGKDLTNVVNFGIDLGSHYHLIGLFCDEVRNYHALTAAGKVLGLQSYGKVREEWKAPLKKFFTSSVPYWYNLENKKKLLSEEIGIEFSSDNRLNGEEGNDFARTAQEVFERSIF